MRMKTVIVDDEGLALQLLKAMLAEIEDVDVIAQCRSGSEALNIIDRGGIDLVFLDMEMPALSGIEVAAKITCEPRPAVVFATAHSEYAVDAFGADAADYVLKPLTRERVEKAVQKARRVRVAAVYEEAQRVGPDPASKEDAALATEEGGGGTERTSLRIRDGGRTYFLLKDDIIWVEAAGDYSLIHTRDREYAVRTPIRDLEQRLQPPAFVRVHRSAIISVGQIKEMHKLPKGEARIILSDNAEVKVSRTYSDSLRQIEWDR